jgi:uncharacterized coiled-coil DUF342 family protein
MEALERLKLQYEQLQTAQFEMEAQIEALRSKRERLIATLRSLAELIDETRQVIEESA